MGGGGGGGGGGGRDVRVRGADGKQGVVWRGDGARGPRGSVLAARGRLAQLGASALGWDGGLAACCQDGLGVLTPGPCMQKACRMQWRHATSHSPLLVRVLLARECHGPSATSVLGWVPR
jgi:hypothetical protein